jgi:hypothetical protein
MPNEDRSLDGIAYYEWDGKTLHRLRLIHSAKTDCDGK